MKNILFSFPISAVFLLFLPFFGKTQSTDFNYTATCFGNQTTLTAVSSLPDTSITSWQWDIDGNNIYELSGKTIITLITQDTANVKLRITPNIGSADSVTKNVIIDPLPQVNFISNNLCETKAATYISQSTIASGSITQFLWDFNNDGVTDDNSNDTVSYTCGPASTYITKLTCVSDKGCSAFTQKTTTVYPNPAAGFSASGSGLCDSTLFTNTTAVSNPDFYIWNFGDGNNMTTSGNASHVYAGAGTYTASLVAITLAGCRDTAMQIITISSTPVASFTAANLCVGDLTSFSNTSVISAPDNFIWDFGDGNSAATSGNTDHTYEFAGTYTVSLTAINLSGCQSSVQSVITVNPSPAVSLDLSGDTVIYPGETLTLTATGGSYTYGWTNGETTNSITVDQPGNYYCHVTDVNGCWAHLTVNIVAFETPDTVSVSGFILTPNGDNINDCLIINDIEAYQNCDLKIYNMWNDEVYSVTGYKNDFCGYGNGNMELRSGAYYYIIQCDDKPLLKGNINILR